MVVYGRRKRFDSFPTVCVSVRAEPPHGVFSDYTPVVGFSASLLSSGRHRADKVTGKLI